MYMRKPVLIIVALVVYIATAGISYIFFSKNASALSLSGKIPGNPTAGKTTNDYQALTFDGPKTEPCPLNGALYSKDQRAWWEAHRPLAVMIENSLDARPQSGINAADVT